MNFISLLSSFVLFFTQSVRTDPVALNCSFFYGNGNCYCYLLDNLRIYYENQEIIIENAGNCTTATTFVIKEKFVPYFPKGIDKYFPKLKALQITSSSLRKISQNDVVNFSEIEHLDLCYNSIEVLEEKLFKFNKKLTKIFLNNNKIKEVDPTSFDGPLNITSLELSGNICYSGGSKNNAEVKLLIDNLRTKCWSDSLDIKKLILGVTKEDTGIEILQKIQNFMHVRHQKQSSHQNSSLKFDLRVYDTTNMICICNSSNSDSKNGILYSETFFGMLLMDVLVIINTVLLFIIAATILILKCNCKFQSKPRFKTPDDIHNKLYEEIRKSSKGRQKLLSISKLPRSMELLEKTYHENDVNYDEISAAVCQQEYSTVLNAENVEAIYSENPELYSEVGNITEGETMVTNNVAEPVEEVIYTEVIKRSSGWI